MRYATKFIEISTSLLIMLHLMSVGVLAEETSNYCYDSETNARWERIVKHESHNPDIVNLYNLRKALCMQIEKGFMGVPEATEIFETERERVIKDLAHPRA